MKAKVSLVLALAFLCLGKAGAAVEGNNIAVVVSKAPVVSSTGWQYLCVPVRGFDITGQRGNDGVPLADLLPPSQYAGETQLSIENNLKGEGYLTVTACELGTIENSPAWVADGADVGSQLVAASARIWVKSPSSTENEFAALLGLTSAASAETNAASDDIVFAGEQNLVDYLVPSTVSGMTACGNASSETVAIPHGAVEAPAAATQLIETPQPGDQLLRIGNNRREYVYYLYFGNLWLPMTPESEFEALGLEPYEIAPGEAFYYYRAAAN